MMTLVGRQHRVRVSEIVLKLAHIVDGRKARERHYYAVFLWIDLDLKHSLTRVIVYSH